MVAAVAVAASTFLDGQRVPVRPTMFLLGMTIAFLFGGLPEPRQAIAGFAILGGVNAIVVRNDPTGSWSDMIWTTVIFGIAWTIGFGLGYKFREAEEAKERADATRARAARGGRSGSSGRGARADRAGAPRRRRPLVSVMTVQAAGVRRLLRPTRLVIGWQGERLGGLCVRRAAGQLTNRLMFSRRRQVFRGCVRACERLICGGDPAGFVDAGNRLLEPRPFTVVPRRQAVIGPGIYAGFSWQFKHSRRCGAAARTAANPPGLDKPGINARAYY